MSLNEEQNLIKICQNGDLSAFSGLYSLYLDKIYRFIYYRIGHKETTEDITSQVFLKALKNIALSDFSNNNFSAWVYKIAYNLIVDYYRSNKKTIEIEKVFDLSTNLDLLDELDKSKKVKIIKDSLTYLSPKQKDVLIMRVWDELTYKEISEINGESEASCKVAFSRALVKIKENLPLEYFVLLIILNIIKN